MKTETFPHEENLSFFAILYYVSNEEDKIVILQSYTSIHKEIALYTSTYWVISTPHTWYECRKCRNTTELHLLKGISFMPIVALGQIAIRRIRITSTISCSMYMGIPI